MWFNVFAEMDIKSAVDFNCIQAQQCLSTSVQYQCTVTDYNILRWRIRDENMTSLGSLAYTTVTDLVTTPAPFPNNLPFFNDYTSKSPSLISNISFTVQSSINGYTIYTVMMEMGIWRIVLLILKV